MALTFAGMSLNEYLRQKVHYIRKQRKQLPNDAWHMDDSTRQQMRDIISDLGALQDIQAGRRKVLPGVVDRTKSGPIAHPDEYGPVIYRYDGVVYRRKNGVTTALIEPEATIKCDGCNVYPNQETNTTHMVSQSKIDEAKSRGIVPGATIKCASVPDRYGVVMPTSYWKTTSGGSIDVGLDNKGTQLFAYSGMFNKWSEVITLAPPPIGLQPQDAVKASGAMLAAIADRAAELGLLDRKFAGENGSDYLNSVSVHWDPTCYCPLQVGHTHVKHNLLTPDEFLRRLESTVLQPVIKITEPLIGRDLEHTVKFNKGSITVGRTTVPNETVRKIAANLKD